MRALGFLVLLLAGIFEMQAQGVAVNVGRDGKTDYFYTVTGPAGAISVGSKIAGRTYATSTRTATTVAKYPTNALADSSVGDRQWSNLDRVYSDNASYATSVSVAQNDSTHYLWANDFVFDLPHDAVITGIGVSFETLATDSVSYLNVVTRLVKAGSITGSDLAVNALLDNDATVSSFGGIASMWGVTWSVAQVEDSAFGVVLMFTDTSTAAGKTISVDYVSVTIYYTAYTTSITADTTQFIRTANLNELWVQLSAKDSINLIPQYRLSQDGVTWTSPVTMDSLKVTTAAFEMKSINVSAPADSAEYIQFIFNINRSAYAPGTTTPTYSAKYMIKPD